MKTESGSPLTKKHLVALKELRTREDILLSKPDKGAGVVPMNKNDYVEKMTLILSDDSKFIRSKDGKDRTSTAEAQMTDCLKRLKHQDIITKEIFEEIKPLGAVTSRLYGLPKIHKPNAPLRPI